MSILKLANITNVTLENGDAGIILKPSGDVKLFTSGDIDPLKLTPEQEAQGRKLMVIAAILQVPELMEMIEDSLARHSADLLDLGSLQ